MTFFVWIFRVVDSILVTLVTSISVKRYFTFIDMGSLVLYNGVKEGTGVRCEVEKLIKYNEQLDMIYMTNDGVISQRRIRVFKVNRDTLQAYCYLRESNRTFKIGNILALVPIQIKEKMVV